MSLASRAYALLKRLYGIVLHNQQAAEAEAAMPSWRRSGAITGWGRRALAAVPVVEQLEPRLMLDGAGQIDDPADDQADLGNGADDVIIKPIDPIVPLIPPTPTVSIPYYASDVEVTEGDSGTKDMEFTIELDQSTSETVCVEYRTVYGYGTATANSDYQSTRIPLVILRSS